MVHENINGDSGKKVKLRNTHGGENPQGGRGNELNKEGKTMFKKNNACKIKYKKHAGEEDTTKW